MVLIFRFHKALSIRVNNKSYFMPTITYFTVTLTETRDYRRGRHQWMSIHGNFKNSLMSHSIVLCQ